MIKLLLKAALLWALLAVIYWLVLRNLFAWPRDAVGSILGSLISSLAIGTLLNARHCYRDKRLVQESIVASSLPSQRTPAAVSGVITARQEAVRTPFGQRNAVAYIYDVTSRTGLKSGRGESEAGGTRGEQQVLSGFRMIPFSIEDQRGSVSVHCFPSLEDFPRRSISRNGVVERAQTFASETQFEDFTRFSVSANRDLLREMTGENNGDVERHLLIRRDDNWDRHDYKETVVTPGEQVVAIGSFDPSTSALVADDSFPGTVCRFFRGDASDVLRQINVKAQGYLLGGAMIFLIGHGLLIFGLTRP